MSAPPPHTNTLPTELGEALRRFERAQSSQASLSDIIFGGQDGLPFFFFPIGPSILVSIGLTALTLFGAGIYKAKTMVGYPGKSGLEMAVIGTISALAGYLIGALFSAPATPWRHQGESISLLLLLRLQRNIEEVAIVGMQKERRIAAHFVEQFAGHQRMTGSLGVVGGPIGHEACIETVDVGLHGIIGTRLLQCPRQRTHRQRVARRIDQETAIL
jgi:hypothetical protein